MTAMIKTADGNMKYSNPVKKCYLYTVQRPTDQFFLFIMMNIIALYHESMMNSTVPVLMQIIRYASICAFQARAGDTHTAGSGIHTAGVIMA